MPVGIVAWLLVAGTVVYCFLALWAVWRYQSVPAPKPEGFAPISVLKPLNGADGDLAPNLRSFFGQIYPGEFEMVFAVAREDDPALAVVRAVEAESPHVPSRILVVGEPPLHPPWNNAKVWSLDHLVRAAKHDLLVMADADVYVETGMLRTLASEFAQDAKLGVATCPYRAVGGPSIWSELEALGMNTEFLAGVLVARLLEGMRFTLGPTVAARKAAIEAIGGWGELRNYLAEDFVLGQRVTAAGWHSILSRCVVEHRIGSEPLGANFSHRLRWNRSTRRSRPGGYIGQLFTNPLPIFLFAWPFTGFSAGFLAAGLLLRFTLAGATLLLIAAPLHSRLLWQLPAQDLLSFAFWIAGFFGNEIHWRGRVYTLRADGTFTLKPKSPVLP
jgi:ceramide glucosyltransferase